MTQLKIGKLHREPNPLCPNCKNYLKLGNMEAYWYCLNCYAEYEADEDKND